MEFIENPISNKLEKAEMTIQEIKEAKNELLRLSASDKERMKYEDRRAALLDKVSALENAEEKGIEIGKKEGTIEVAKNLIEAGIDIEIIIIDKKVLVDIIQLIPFYFSNFDIKT